MLVPYPAVNVNEQRALVALPHRNLTSTCLPVCDRCAYTHSCQMSHALPAWLAPANKALLPQPGQDAETGQQCSFAQLQLPQLPHPTSVHSVLHCVRARHTSVMQCGASLHQLGRACLVWRRISASQAGSQSCSACTMFTNCSSRRQSDNSR